MIRLLIVFSLLFSAMSILAVTHAQTDLDQTIQQRINYHLAETAVTRDTNVSYDFSLDTKSLPTANEVLAESQLPALVKSFVLPVESAQLVISKMTTNVYNLQGEYLYSYETVDPKRIYIADSFYFKEARGFTVFIDLYTLSSDEIHVIHSGSFSLSGSGEFSRPTEVSEAFYESYRSLFANFDSSYLVDLQYKKLSMLIVSHTILNENPSFVNYLNWKRASGIDIHIVYIDDIGGTVGTTQVHDLIATKYNELSNKPDFLLLIGGARSGSSYYIPTYQIPAIGTADIVVSDFDYSLIEGADYFPEMITGRFSGSLSNMYNAMFFKTQSYEKATAENTSNWYNRATLAAANYASASLQPVTPIITSRWMAEKLRSIGYTTTELYHPESATNDITAAVNLGSSIVTYRGWGSANGWHLPQYNVSNVTSLNNGARMPVVYSVVCATGDFVNTSYNPSFGEQWMSVGATNLPKGAVGFVGPSYLHTSTDYNNSLASGITWGIVHQNIRIFGSTVMRGKIEMYNNFPREITASDNVPFYFRIYNMLSDPSLNMWVKEPIAIPTTLPASVTAYDNAIEINAPGVSYGHVTATRNNSTYTFARIVNGHAILPLPNTDTSTNSFYSVTITARNRKPIQSLVQITNDSGVGMISHAITGGAFMAGKTAQITITMKNFGTTTEYFVPTLTSSSPFVTVLPDGQIGVTLEAGLTGDKVISVSLADNCPDDLDIPFSFNMGGHVAKFSMVAGGYVFDVTSAVPQNLNQVFEPGDSGTLTLTIRNAKNIAVSDITATVTALTDAIDITQNTFTISSIAPDGDTTGDISLSVGEQCFIGRICPFIITFTKDGEIVARTPFTMTIGTVTPATVTGPDNYGYYAYDSSDVGYDATPTYSWVDIPETAQTASLPDDTTVTIDLPFGFIFYGSTHNRLSINDNGWASFGDTYNIDFRNWSLPSMLGPKDMLAIFWDDLKGQRIPDTNPAEYDDVVVRYWHDTTNNRFIVTWVDAYFSQDQNQTAGTVKFQLILLPNPDTDGDIIYQYHDIFNFSQNRNYASIGIQNASHTDGICYSFSDYYQDSATPLVNGLAIKFTTTPPDPYVADSDISNMPLPAVTLHQNYPNPFNPTTTITFDLKTPAGVTLNIYNLRGQKVKTLLHEKRDAGTHTVLWNGTNDHNEPVASGIYFYQLQTGVNQSTIKKMILMK